MEEVACVMDIQVQTGPPSEWGDQLTNQEQREQRHGGQTPTEYSRKDQ